jgi:hypothetical protein
MKLLSGCMAGLMIATTCTGCFSTWDISPRELNRLNGYREPQVVPIADNNGKEVAFDPRTELRFYGPDGEMQDKAKFASIDVAGSTFTGIARGERRTVSVDLSQVSEVQARKFSIGKTIAVGVGVPAGVALVLTIVVVAVAASTVTSVGSSGNPR